MNWEYLTNKYIIWIITLQQVVCEQLPCTGYVCGKLCEIIQNFRSWLCFHLVQNTTDAQFSSQISRCLTYPSWWHRSVTWTELFIALLSYWSVALSQTREVPVYNRWLKASRVNGPGVNLKDRILMATLYDMDNAPHVQWRSHFSGTQRHRSCSVMNQGLFRR